MTGGMTAGGTTALAVVLAFAEFNRSKTLFKRSSAGLGMTEPSISTLKRRSIENMTLKKSGRRRRKLKDGSMANRGLDTTRNSIQHNFHLYNYPLSPVDSARTSVPQMQTKHHVCLRYTSCSDTLHPLGCLVRTNGFVT